MFTATDYKDTLEYFAVKQQCPKTDGSHLPLKYSVVTAQERQIQAYAPPVEGGAAP